MPMPVIACEVCGRPVVLISWMNAEKTRALAECPLHGNRKVYDLANSEVVEVKTAPPTEGVSAVNTATVIEPPQRPAGEAK